MARHHALLVLITACGSSNKVTPDAATDARAIDARAIVDAPPDAPPDAAPDAAMATGPHHHFVISAAHFPTTNAEAKQLGLDLDNNGTVDNQIGAVLAVLGTQGFSTQPAVDKAVDTGAVLMLADVESSDLTTSALAGFTLFSGSNPDPTPCTGPTDTVCRHHLDGTGTFDIAAGSERDTPLAGAIVNGVLTAGPGTLTIELPLLGSMPVSVSLIGARARLASVTTAGFTGAIVAGGITQSELDTKVYPALQTTANAAIVRDCTMVSAAGALQTPACGCAAGSTGGRFEALFDTATPKDCMVSLAEITTNPVVTALFALDVTIGGQKAISIGFGVDAVAGTFTP